MPCETEWLELPTVDGVHVTAWEQYGKRKNTINFSDCKGDLSLSCKRYRELSAEDKATVKAALATARKRLNERVAAEQTSRAAINERWRPDMIRYNEEKREPWGLIEKTLAGTNYAYAKDCRELGTYQEGQFGKALTGHAYDTRLTCYYGCLIDGGICVDISEPLEGNPGLSYASPMLDTHRTTVDRFAESIAADSWLLDLFAEQPENGFCGVARLAKIAAKVPTLQAFDNVPLSVWLAWWRDRGSRIGQRDGNTIIWEDGTREEIRPVDQRWKVDGQIVSA